MGEPESKAQDLTATNGSEGVGKGGNADEPAKSRSRQGDQGAEAGGGDKDSDGKSEEEPSHAGSGSAKSVEEPAPQDGDGDHRNHSEGQRRSPEAVQPSSGPQEADLRSRIRDTSIEGDEGAESASSMQERSATQDHGDAALDAMDMGRSTVGDIRRQVEQYQTDPQMAQMFEGYDPFAHQTPQEFMRDNMKADGGWDFPGNDGFDGPTYTDTANPGEMLDRFGLDQGQFLSPAGTPYADRALPPDSVTLGYNEYMVLKPFDMTAGRPCDGFGQTPSSDALQYKLGTTPEGKRMTVEWLVSNGYLESTP